MATQVNPEVLCSVEHLTADVAAVVALVHVSPQMSPQIVALSEGGRAQLAVVWPLTRVDTEVPLQVARLRKPVWADGTLEGAFAGVTPHVPIQAALGGERLDADVASVRRSLLLQLLPSMSACVNLETELPGEFPGTLVAVERARGLAFSRVQAIVVPYIEQGSLSFLGMDAVQQ